MHHLLSFFVIIFILLTTNKVLATHIRAGEITAVRISNTSLTYEFSIIGYTDTGSIVLFGQGDINFGDGTILNLANYGTSTPPIPVGGEVASNLFKIFHTFQAPGKYIISYIERNRNAGVKNISNSVDTPFYVETEILIDPFLGINNTPVFLVPPVDEAAVGAIFIHNPGAFDLDGDSLSYHLVIPKQSVGTDVTGYLPLNHPKFYPNGFSMGNQAKNGEPTFSIDEISGDLIWDAPGDLGEYNIAFVVKEWRKVQGVYFQLGSVTRDMQIIVQETDNTPPEVIIPAEICVEAGTTISEEIIGLDPDGHQVKLEAFGGPLQFAVNPASFMPFPPSFQPQPGTLNFTWLTDCNQVRSRPYEIQFKATDNPPQGPKLADIKTLSVTVVGVAPTGLSLAVVNGKTIRLDWDIYNCGTADKMQIWRRVESFNFVPDNCEIGLPSFAGYELIALIEDIKYIDANNNINYKTSFIDDNNEIGLSSGANYCYRLVAQFPDPAGGESYASEEVCQIIRADLPVVLNVDIRVTDNTNGEVRVRWMKPFEVDKIQFPPPYTYEVIRAENFSGNTNEISIGITQDTVIIDIANLNTTNLVYNYKIKVFDSGNNFIGESPSASTVKLEVLPLVGTIELNWRAMVPWSNQLKNYPYHIIYRDQVDPLDLTRLVLIDSSNVSMNGLVYFDAGLSDAIEYCYYVKTKGSYGNENIIEPLINRSQITCTRPNDIIPPCTPIDFRLNNLFSCEEILANSTCIFNNYSNKLIWDLDQQDVCQDDVRSFNIYFSEDGSDNYQFVENVTGFQYTHTNLNSFKGCYKIAAVDRSMNESPLSEAMCNDNCPNFKMPNAFSPNGDGINEFFTPLIDNIDRKRINNFDFANCPRFVNSIIFKIFDRTGKEIFSFNSAQGTNPREVSGSVLFKWDGKNNAGIDLPAGLYYYSADVTFDVLDISKSVQNFKGWVQLLK